MSGGEFHVHGVHEHAVEHQAHSGDSFAARIAVMTAILSTIGALFAFQGAAEQNSALLLKNEAAIRRAEASDQWAFYQSKSNKQNLAELGAAFASGDMAASFRKEAERYKAEKAEIEPKARELEKAATEASERSEAAMHVHHRWAQAMTLVQIAISLAAITLLTRKRWLQGGAYIAGAGGVALAVLALLHI
ncbi:MAG: DUF4337 domain-containing protein [Proteobacteria bacterium]|nr:DUF4337 domain-containing protein [Pseudomonadota bacterium]